MIGIRRSFISPILCFDLYLENYHQLTKNLDKESDVKQIRNILKRDLEGSLQDTMFKEDYDAMVITGVDQNIVWVNRGFTEMTGYSKSYAIGKRPSFLQGKHTSKSTLQVIKDRLINKQTYKGSILNYRKNGETYLCQIKIMPLYNHKKELTHFIALEKEQKAA